MVVHILLLFNHNIQCICNSIKDVFEGWNEVYPVSFDLKDDDKLLGHGYEE